MRKKILALMLAFACVAGTVSAVAQTQQPVEVEAGTKKKAPTLKQVYQAVKQAYGDDYIPSERLDKDMIKDRYGISGSWYSGAIAELPLMSVHADELVIVKAKNADTKKKIKRALQNYQKQLKADVHQYPANQLKLQASKVYVKGNYVCFFVLGSIDNATEQQSDEKVIAAYKKQNEKAVKAIQKLYQ